MRNSLKAMLAAGALLTLGTFASPAAAHPCAGDAQSICSEFIPDRGKVASCLFKNKRALCTRLLGCRLRARRQGPKVSRKAKGKRYGKRKKRYRR